MKAGCGEAFNYTSAQLGEIFRVQNQQRGGLVTSVDEARQNDPVILCLSIRRFHKYRF